MRTRQARLLVPLAVTLAACAGPVRPVLVSPPALTAGAGPRPRVAVLGRVEPLVAEAARLLEQMGAVERRDGAPGSDLRAACADGVDLAARVEAGQPLFASNAGERNTLFIYESAVVVGLPVTLISVVAWPWYGDISTKGTLETLWCATGTRVSTQVLASVRDKGRGFIRTARLHDELEQQLYVELARKLIQAAADCGRLQSGGDKC